MRILMINKFLHPSGGAENYVFRLGAHLSAQGHEVQYFGMTHEGRCVGNAANAYTREMDFHGGPALEKLTYPLKVIYSPEARHKLRCVLDSFAPDVVHLNNFSYQLTPSVILETVKWRKQTGSLCRIVYTAHDYNLVCPNHMLMNPRTRQGCERCLGGCYLHGLAGRCIHGSLAKSAIGAAEAYIWRLSGVYRHIDAVVCCSSFMKSRLEANPHLAGRTVLLRNFADPPPGGESPRRDYVLYFGRFSQEKGIALLADVCRRLPEVRFVFAGTGPLEGLLRGLPNVRVAGFQMGEALGTLIRGARFSICPSEWAENCPLSVMESLLCGTPVLAADVGGIPELIEQGRTGELFESGSGEALKAKIERLWADPALTERYSRNCRGVAFDTVETYAQKLMRIYQG